MIRSKIAVISIIVVAVVVAFGGYGPNAAGARFVDPQAGECTACHAVTQPGALSEGHRSQS